MDNAGYIKRRHVLFENVLRFLYDRTISLPHITSPVLVTRFSVFRIPVVGVYNEKPSQSGVEIYNVHYIRNIQRNFEYIVRV